MDCCAAARSVSWGLGAPEGTKVYWGSRCIFYPSQYIPHARGKEYTDASLDVLSDRASCSEEATEDFLEWVRAQFKSRVFKQWLNSQSTSSSAVYEHTEGSRHFKASPNRSYGYMYIGAWEDNGNE